MTCVCPLALSGHACLRCISQRTPDGVMNVEAGHSMNGHSAGMAMEVFNGGTTELTALIMFVVDATKPFSVPAKFE
jgi:hypothetical protein